MLKEHPEDMNVIESSVKSSIWGKMSSLVALQPVNPPLYVSVTR